MNESISLEILWREYIFNYRIYKDSDGNYIFYLDMGLAPDCVLDVTLTPFPEIYFYPSGRCVYWCDWVKPRDRKKISFLVKKFIVKDIL